MCASRDGVLLYSSVPLSPHTFHPPTCCQAGPVRRYAEVDASGQEAADTKPWELLEIPRSREVGQWYITSVWTTLRAMLHAVALVWHVSPQVSEGRRRRWDRKACGVVPGCCHTPPPPGVLLHYYCDMAAERLIPEPLLSLPQVVLVNGPA